MTILVKIIIDIVFALGIITHIIMEKPFKYNFEFRDWLDMVGTVIMYIVMVSLGVYIWFI